MTFIDARLPDAIELNAQRIETEDIIVVLLDGGKEVRNARHAQSKFEFDIGFPPGAYDGATIEAVIAMFRATRGGLHRFRFRDWDPKNSTLDSTETIGTGDGTTTQFQIIKSWTVGSVTSTRYITRPVTPLSVYLDGVLQSSGYTVDYTTGIITFSAAPTVGVLVSVGGYFDIPVRFDKKLTATGITHAIQHLGSITLVEAPD